MNEAPKGTWVAGQGRGTGAALLLGCEHKGTGVEKSRLSILPTTTGAPFTWLYSQVLQEAGMLGPRTRYPKMSVLWERKALDLDSTHFVDLFIFFSDWVSLYI